MPSSDAELIAELHNRLDMMVSVTEDAEDLVTTLIGSGYSATTPEFQLGIYLGSLSRQASNLRQRANMIYRRSEI